MSEEITRMPAVALRGMTILPSMIVHFDVSRDKSIKAIEQAMTADQKLFVVTQRDPEASIRGSMICITSVPLWRSNSL